MGNFKGYPQIAHSLRELGVGMLLKKIYIFRFSTNNAMRITNLLFISLFILSCNTSKDITAQPQSEIPSAPMTEFTKNMQPHEGYFNFYWDDKAGKIWLEIDKFDQEFLYVNSLPAGIGSNDIGLDRGQLGQDRVVKFVRSGPKILLVQLNYDYRAVSDNEDEKRSVEQAFAQSVIGGFKVEVENEGKVLVDLTQFLLRDAHYVARRLKQNKQGSYKIDKNRSAIYLPMTKNFPQNTEFEATITFEGDPEGRYIRSVVPSPDAVTVRMHHSFIQLPDANYQPRKFDPRSGFFGIRYQDYATPIDQSLVKRFISRHRLEKKDPSATTSEAVEPIIYYLDRGAPEPIRSALIEGASWWNQAFEAAGYKNAFQVKVLPPDADPMDVRYNLIQWVHRSTRGWSYGSSVTDPRTGEIIKGHVSLGSLRVRQDFLIAQGFIKAYEEGKEPSLEMLKLALARLRQLSAHEVGHTLGITHNFASSFNGRASVMDYPHPLISLDADGNISFDDVYDVGIGEWDKRTILYGYQDFPAGTNEDEALNQILQQTIDQGLYFISDADARPTGGAHPQAHLWDNGTNAADELNRKLKVRAMALEEFGPDNIPIGTPMANLEEVLVPLYFSHRYQIEATAKVLGGVYYTYAVKGDGQPTTRMIPAQQQLGSLEALIRSLQPEVLAIPESINKLIPPRPMGYQRGRENFNINTGFTLDPLAAAEASANHTLNFLLHPQRANRLVEFRARNDQQPGFQIVTDRLLDFWKDNQPKDTYQAEIARIVQYRILDHLMKLGMDERAIPQVKAIVYATLNRLEAWLKTRQQPPVSSAFRIHNQYCQDQIELYKRSPEKWKPGPLQEMPDGSPIGMECMH